MFYIYKHPSEEKFVEVEQSMNDKHEFFDETGLQWERVFTLPNLGFDMKIDPFSDRQFLDKTNKGGKIGDLFDRSKELSQMRAEKRDGVDPHEQKANEKWSKERLGKKIPKKLKDLDIEIKLKK